MNMPRGGKSALKESKKHFSGEDRSLPFPHLLLFISHFSQKKLGKKKRRLSYTSLSRKE
jgi:hypothetical protein